MVRGSIKNDPSYSSEWGVLNLLWGNQFGEIVFGIQSTVNMLHCGLPDVTKNVDVGCLLLRTISATRNSIYLQQLQPQQMDLHNSEKQAISLAQF